MGDGTKERTGAPGNEADQFEELVETDSVEAIESQEENRQESLRTVIPATFHGIEFNNRNIRIDKISNI